MSFVLDCSHYQGTINWSAVKASGCIGAYIKVTDGTATIDPNAVANHAGARATGVPCGPYHFSEDSNATAEANHFAQMWSWGWDLDPVLDEEKATATPSYIIAFRSAFRSATDYQPFRTYGMYAMLKPGGQLDMAGSWLAADANTTVWAARYNSTLGLTHPKLVLWQNTSSAATPGIAGSTDSSTPLNGWSPAADQSGDTDMAVTDPLPVKRPDGSVPTVGDALGNLYIGEFYGGTSGPAVVTSLAQILTQLAAIQGSLTANQTAVLAAITGIPSQGTPSAAQMQALTAALTASLPDAVRKDLGAALSAS